MNAELSTQSLSGTSPILQISRATKTFGATQALRGVSFEIYRGEILALLGENGAGKSTIIKALAGIHKLDHGELRYDGEIFDPLSQSSGMAFIHQDHGLIEWMTVAENISLYLGYPRKHGLIDISAAHKRAAQALNEIGANFDPDTRISSLNRAERSIVAISRALLSDAKILVLDEPTASLHATDVARLFQVLRNLRARGVAMIYVSHRLDEVFEIADRMVVLRDGEVVGTRQVSSATPAETIKLIVGGSPESLYVRKVRKPGAIRLKLKRLHIAGGYIDAQFGSGEIVGLVGLRGAGQERVGRAMFGLEPAASGEIWVDDKVIKPKSPAEAIAEGVCLVWGDRTNGSIVPMMQVRENLYLNLKATGSGDFALLDTKKESRQAKEFGNILHLRPNDPGLNIDSLSGGNQQKVIVGRWLQLKGKIYIFEDPTAGVDVGARAEIYKLLDEVRAMGATILIISSDFEEVSNVCERAYVFDKGEIVTELNHNDLTLPNLLAAASASIQNI